MTKHALAAAAAFFALAGPATAGPGPVAEPSPRCEPFAVNVTTATAVRSNVQAGRSVCVTGPVGNVNLDSLTSGATRHVGTAVGGSVGAISLAGSSNITVQARFRSTMIRDSSRITINNSVIGGTQSARVMDQLIFMPGTNPDVEISNNDIGWTDADNSGNTGYGCRCWGTMDRFRFVNNRVHDVAADGFQGVGGTDVLIDSNIIGPVGASPSSSEHSDNIQITGNGPGLRITNNWIHHQGYYNGQVTGNAGATYIHGGSTGSLLYENNLVEVARGRVEFCGLGTGGTGRSNTTVRGNTFVDLGQAYGSFPGLEWDCDSGTGNLLERNIAVDPDGGYARNGTVVESGNLFGAPGLVELDASGTCVSANCVTPAGRVGYVGRVVPDPTPEPTPEPTPTATATPTPTPEPTPAPYDPACKPDCDQAIATLTEARDTAQGALTDARAEIARLAAKIATAAAALED